MKRTSVLTLVFAALSVFFFLLLIFLRIPFPLYPLMSVQDAADLLTPLVLIPVYWMLFMAAAQGRARPAEQITFMLAAAFWTMGQGMHLSANSVNNLSENLAKQKVLDILSSDIYRLTYFYDEHLSHYIWHIGILAMMGLLIYACLRCPGIERTDWRFVISAGVLYGVTNFLVFLEGQTVPLGLPLTVVASAAILAWGRRKLGEQPILAFLLIACTLSWVLLSGWGLYWGGFLQLSEVGWI